MTIKVINDSTLAHNSSRIPELFVLFVSVLAVISFISCKHNATQLRPSSTEDASFPDSIASIIQTKCAVSGCHNSKSYTGAGGLLLDSWEHMFDGGNNGAVAIPFCSDFSPLIYFINTKESLGFIAEPTMPPDGIPLNDIEYFQIKNWINAGAPNSKGEIPFNTNSVNRQKIYTVQQDCDLIAVIDAEKNIIMRYIKLGKEPYPESISDIRMSPEGRYLYVCYWYSPYIQKIDATKDELIAEINIGNSFNSHLVISEDGNLLAVTNEDDNTLRFVQTANMTLQQSLSLGMIRPKSLVANADLTNFYITSRLGNTIYKVSGNSLNTISLDGNPAVTSPAIGQPDPWFILSRPDKSQHFIACAGSNDIRVLDAHADTLVKIIPVGKLPQQMALSYKQPYLFVSCMEEPVSASKSKGSVYVINYNTLEVVRKIEGKLYEPYSIAVDDRNGWLYIFSKNLTADGPAPHHGSPCNGRNGFYNIYDLNTLEPISPKRYEILVNPGASTVRFTQ